MSRLAYVNGRYAPHGEAAVHVEDRGKFLDFYVAHMEKPESDD